jgi:hypothetical protein
MNAHVRDNRVTEFEFLITAVELPDAGDRHMVAAAIHGGASLIVSFNLKGFLPERLKPCNLAVQHPRYRDTRFTRIVARCSSRLSLYSRSQSTILFGAGSVQYCGNGFEQDLQIQP